MQPPTPKNDDSIVRELICIGDSIEHYGRRPESWNVTVPKAKLKA